MIKTFADRHTLDLYRTGRYRKGQCAVFVNDQWRICFRFEAGDAFDVEIVDYH